MAEQVQAAEQTMVAAPSDVRGDLSRAGDDRPAWLVQFEAVTQSKSFRQLGALIGLAALVSFAIGFVLWSGKESGMQPLYDRMGQQEAAQVAEALRGTGIKFELDRATGQIMVPSDRLHEIRLQLAGQGLPGGAPVGFDALHKEPSLGVSQFMEGARYQNALENELATTIASLNPVDSARVHLALPKQSVFVRERQPATASVVVKLYPGRALEPGQVQAIVNLVAGSVPNMKAADVTVVDQAGRLLSEDVASSGVALNGRHFDHRRRVEQNYVKRVEQLLQPMVGAGRVLAEVNAELDFSEREGTSERYGPNEGRVRSEQLADQVSNVGGGALGGIPGALSNQPPGGGVTTPPGGNGIGPEPLLNPQQYQQLLQTPAQTSKSQTRNYEIDRDIQHTKTAPGEIKRLTVAVVLDDRVSVNETGEAVRKPLSEEDLAKFTQLVKEAVGFDEARGDRVTVSNVAFSGEQLIEEAAPFYTQPWAWDIAKQLLLGLAALLVFLVVARTLLRALLGEKKHEVSEAELAALPAGEGVLALPGAATAESAAAEEVIRAMAEAGEAGEGELMTLFPGAEGYAEKIEHLRKLIEHDPRLVATVFKQWTREDG